MNRMDRFWIRIGRALTDWRFLATVFILAICVALGLAVSAADDAQEVSRRVAARDATANRQVQIVAHGTCLRLNNGRLRIRAYLGEAVRLAFDNRLPGQPPLTEEQRVALDALAKSISDAGESILPPVDCDKTIPLPPNMTADERGQVYKPGPIVIPGD